MLVLYLHNHDELVFNPPIFTQFIEYYFKIYRIVNVVLVMVFDEKGETLSVCDWVFWKYPIDKMVWDCKYKYWQDFGRNKI